MCGLAFQHPFYTKTTRISRVLLIVAFFLLPLFLFFVHHAYVRVVLLGTNCLCFLRPTGGGFAFFCCVESRRIVAVASAVSEWVVRYLLVMHTAVPTVESA